MEDDTIMFVTVFRLLTDFVCLYNSSIHKNETSTIAQKNMLTIMIYYNSRVCSMTNEATNYVPSAGCCVNIHTVRP